jgi:hypothetical protein
MTSRKFYGWAIRPDCDYNQEFVPFGPKYSNKINYIICQLNCCPSFFIAIDDHKHNSITIIKK